MDFGFTDHGCGEGYIDKDAMTYEKVIENLENLEILEILETLETSSTVTGRISSTKSVGELEKEKVIPRWDCVDGSKGSVMSQFSIKTLGSMKGSLEKARDNQIKGNVYHKPYVNNFDAKMQYILERIKDE